MKILCVDDEMSMIMIYQDYFRSIKGDIVYSFDGFQAMKEVLQSIEEEDLFDLIVLDIEMPNMGGLECLKQIREIEEESNAKKSKVFIVTASEELTDVLLAFEGKADAFIVKDYNLNARLELEVMKAFGVAIGKTALKLQSQENRPEYKR